MEVASLALHSIVTTASRHEAISSAHRPPFAAITSPAMKLVPFAALLLLFSPAAFAETAGLGAIKSYLLGKVTTMEQGRA